MKLSYHDNFLLYSGDYSCTTQALIAVLAEVAELLDDVVVGGRTSVLP